MTLAIVFAIAGGLSGTVGSIITAFSVNRMLFELHTAQQLLHVTVESYITERKDVPIFKGTDNRYDAAKTHGSTLTRLGVLLLALGFICQALSVLVG